MIVRDPLELVQALRQRADELDIPREAIDDLAGLTPGYASKLLATPPIKGIGPITLFALLGALGYSLALVVDEQRMVRIDRIHRTGYKRRPFAQEWRNAKALSMMLEMAKTYGKIGAIERMKKVPPEKRSRIARKAAKARWRKPKIIEIRVR